MQSNIGQPDVALGVHLNAMRHEEPAHTKTPSSSWPCFVSGGGGGGGGGDAPKAVAGQGG